MTVLDRPPAQPPVQEPPAAQTPPPPAPARRAGASRPKRQSSVAELMATWMLLSLCVLTLWVGFYALVLSGLQESHAQHNLYAKFRQELVGLSHVAPLGGRITPGAPVALVSAPTLGLRDLVVVEGTAPGDLEKGPGHKRDSPLPGQSGIALVYGRATQYGGPFSDITHARQGDHVTVTTGQGTFTYAVRDVRHVGDPLPAPVTSGMVFVTSEGASAANLWRPTKPVYVDMKLLGKPQPTPPKRISQVAESELAMHNDIGSLVPLVLWLPVLAAALVATLWAAERWGRVQAWLVGAPVVVAVLWVTTSTATQLLPNLM